MPTRTSRHLAFDLLSRCFGCVGQAHLAAKTAAALLATPQLDPHPPLAAFPGPGQPFSTWVATRPSRPATTTSSTPPEPHTTKT